ncbi:MAG: tetratricopeptide repeat protein, partial [Desulfobacterales bacterium]
TALSLLGPYSASRNSVAFEQALLDDEALIRRTAVDQLNIRDPKRRARLLTSALYDPVTAVRTEAARRMSEIPTLQLDTGQKKVYLKALAEYQGSMEYSADFAFGRYNLGNLYAALKQPEKAAENYLAAIRIDNQFFPAKVNLAMLYNQMGRKDEAETLLREVVAAQSDLHEIRYSLGQLLAEKKQYEEAARHLASAAAGLPQRSRVHYNLGLLLQQLKRDAEAEAALLTALEIEPDNLDYLYALTDFYLKRQKFNQARQTAERMIQKHPNNQLGREILNYINTQTSNN